MSDRSSPISGRAITQICSFYSALGGIERSVMYLASSFQRICQVTVLCTKFGAGSQVEDCGGVKVIRSGGAFSVRGRPLSWALFGELKKQDVDVLHYHLPFPLATLGHLLVRPKAKAVVASWHHDLARDRFFRIVYSPLLNLFLDRVDAIIVSMPALIDTTPALAKQRDKCTVIPFGVDPVRFDKPNPENIESLRKRYGTPLILSVGRLVYYKGHFELLQAMKNVQASLVIVGDGPLRNRLEAYIGQHQLKHRVHLLGTLPDEEVAAFYHACDVFAFPSTVHTEAFGIVQVEAMMCGKPVVNTSLPTGVPWVSLDGETGITVPPADSQALARALTKLLSDSALRAEFGARAKERAHQTFSLDAFVAATIDLYQRILERKA